MKALRIAEQKKEGGKEGLVAEAAGGTVPWAWLRKVEEATEQGLRCAAYNADTPHCPSSAHQPILPNDSYLRITIMMSKLIWRQ